jgi:hypothetical protein
MFSLIYGAVRGVVANFSWAALCGLAPALYAGGLARQFLHGDWPGWAYLPAIVPLLFLHTMYTVALCRRMALPHQEESFIAAMMWDQRKTEFLVINSVGFIVFGVLAFILADWALGFYRFSLDIKAAKPAAAGDLPFADSYRVGTVNVFFFGSRALAAAFGAVALFIWIVILRWVIKLPAAAADRYISFDEAKSLTHGHVMEILAANALLNAGLIIALGILEISAADSVGGESPRFTFAAMGCAYWVLSSFNISLWTEMYHRYTTGYKLRAEYYWKQ